MKLFYTVVLLLSVKQCVYSAPTEDYNASANDWTPRDQLVNYYAVQFSSLTEQIPQKLKHIIELLLKDDTIQKAQTPLSQEFKKNISEFSILLPLYQRYNWPRTMQMSFTDIMTRFLEPLDNKADKDVLYIQQLLKQFGYFELREKYKNDFKNFVSKEFSEKYEEIKKENSNSELEIFEQKCSKFLEKLKQCKQYECYLTSPEETLLTPKQKFVEKMNSLGGPINMLMNYNVTLFAQAIINEPKLSQLHPTLKQQMIEIFQNFLEKYENTKNVYDLTFIPALFEQLKETRHTSDRELLVKIHDDHGLKELVSNFETAAQKLFDRVFIKEFQLFISSLDQQELEKNKYFVNLFERSKRANTAEERNEIIFDLAEFSKTNKELQERGLFN